MKNKTEIQIFCILITVFLISASCSTDYKNVIVDEEYEGTPNFVLYNFSETVVEKGVPAYSVKAEKAEAFENKKITVIENLYFAEYSSDNAVTTEGTAGKATYHSDNDNIIFEENLYLNAIEQGFYVTGDYLFWESGSRSLTGSEEGLVTIGREDGSLITGRGFSSSAADRSFTFEKSVEGKYVSDETDETDETDE